MGPVKTSGLYYCDVASDYSFMITLYRNCHYKYGLMSLAILCFSYFVTVLYLAFCMKQNMKKAILYPCYHGRNLLAHTWASIIAIWHGDRPPEATDEVKNFTHTIEFLEIMTESVFQLCLSCMVLREYGLSSDAFESFTQLSGLCFSLLSICITFSQVRKLEIFCITFHLL